MISKTQQAKDKQGYTKHPRQCNTCIHYKSEMMLVQSEWRSSRHEEKKKRCGIGGFAVQSTASCDLYAKK